MSHGVQNVGREDVPTIVSERLREIAPTTRGVLLLLVALGIGALSLGASGESSANIWAAFHVNAVFWLFLSASSACFTAVLQICNAQWARPIRRIFEAGSGFFVYSWIPFVVLYLFGGDELFIWFHKEIPGKGAWLHPTFVYARDILALLLLIYLTRRIIRFSLARDIGAIRSGITGLAKDQTERWHAPMYDGYVRQWRGDPKGEIQKLNEKMGRSAPVIVIVYSLVMALVAFDQIMAVDPYWFSTLFGAFIFMAGVYTAVAWCAMSIGVYRELSPLYRAKFTRKVLWDLGKLLFGFGIFWAYLFWSHYITIWYGNLPEETGWMILRLRDEPWHSLAWMVLGMSFIYPFFFGLSRDVKQVPELLFFTGLVVTIGQFLMHYLLFVPTVSPNQIPFGVQAILITAAFAATYVLLTRRFLERYPLVPFGDLYVEEERH